MSPNFFQKPPYDDEMNADLLKEEQMAIVTSLRIPNVIVYQVTYKNAFDLASTIYDDGGFRL